MRRAPCFQLPLGGCVPRLDRATTFSFSERKAQPAIVYQALPVCAPAGVFFRGQNHHAPGMGGLATVVGLRTAVRRCTDAAAGDGAVRPTDATPTVPSGEPTVPPSLQKAFTQEEHKQALQKIPDSNDPADGVALEPVAAGAQAPADSPGDAAAHNAAPAAAAPGDAQAPAAVPSGEPTVPPSLKKAFTTPQYEQLLQKMPDWDTDFVGWPSHKIATELLDLGFPAPRAQKATAILDHFGRNPDQGSGAALRWEKALYDGVVSSTETVDDSCEISLITSKVPWLGVRGDEAHKRVLIRRGWCKHFWDLHRARLCEEEHRVAIIGTPGIGKTVALNYILYMYLKLSKPPLRYVGVILPNDSCYYVFDTKQKRACRVDLDFLPSGASLKNFYGNILVLHDLGKDAPLTPSYLPTVLATSPEYKKYNEFMKGCEKFYYVSPPTDAEMDYMAKTVFMKHDYSGAWAGAVCKTWQDAAFYYGNVPRSVFGQDVSRQKVDSQIDCLNVTTLATLTPTVATADVNDLLVAYEHQGDEHRGVAIRFRPGYVTERLTDRCFRSWVEEWDKIVTFTRNGHVFESVLHAYLGMYMHRVATDSIRALDDGHTTAVVKKVWPKSEVTSVPWSSETTALELETQRYYYPCKSNFPVIDSFMFCREGNSKTLRLLCFQMTVASEHATTADKLEKFFESELEKRFRYKQRPFTIEVEEEEEEEEEGLKLICGQEKFALEVHLIYLVSHANLDSFKRQALDSTASGADPKWKRCWSLIRQYKCGPPKGTS